MPVTFTPQRSRLVSRRPAGGQRRFGAAILACGLGLAALVGGFLMIDDPSSSQEGTCVLAFDTDRGTTAVHARYAEWAGPVIEGCAPYRARVYALPVTSDTATTPISPVDASLVSVKGLGGNPERDKERIHDATVGIIGDVNNMIRQAAAATGHTGTDLLALGPAIDDMLHNPKDKVRHLVVFSDGINARHPYNLSVIALGDEATAEIIGRLDEQHQLPDLRGVTVRWYGAGIGNDADQLPAERLAAIEQFWRKYFTAAGAKLEVYARTP